MVDLLGAPCNEEMRLVYKGDGHMVGRHPQGLPCGIALDASWCRRKFCLAKKAKLFESRCAWEKLDVFSLEERVASVIDIPPCLSIAFLSACLE